MRIQDKTMFIRGLVILALTIAVIVVRVSSGRWISLRFLIAVGLGLLATVYHLVMSLHIDGDDDEEAEAKQA